MENPFDILPDGLRLWREAGQFKLNTDSVLLSGFVRSGFRRVCDLGAGAGVLSLMLAMREADAEFDGVEIQPEGVEIFERNVAENGLGGRVHVHLMDLRRLRGALDAGKYDLVVSNPPYFPADSRTSETPVRAVMRAELGCTVDELCEAAAYLLKNGGRFCVVYRAERLAELICAMSAHGVEPKRLRLVSRDASSRATLALVEGRRQGKAGLEIEPNIFLGEEGARS